MILSTIENLKKNNCCGCTSCVQKCPKNAIEMVEDKEGFLFPSINKEKCINCGLCVKTCPMLNYEIEKKENFPKTLAIKNKNQLEKMKSSSGGVFIVLAKNIIENGGVVYGAAYTKELSVEHIRVDKIDELIKLQGSKYVQSNMNDTYSRVKKDLQENVKVLFTGTPCQVKGLKNFLDKDYNNLLTCDLVCHGVPSQKLFKKYINFLEEKYKKKIKNYDFRNKEKKGWGLTSKVIFDDGTSRYINSDFDPYYSNFLNCNTYRESCYNCKFAKTDRPSDITLADYWGVLSIHNDFYDKIGVSLILVNTEKGMKTIEENRNSFEMIETDLNYASSRNKNLITPSKRPLKRDVIYDKIDELSSKEYCQKVLKYKITPKKILKLFIPDKLKKNIKIYIIKIKRYKND